MSSAIVHVADMKNAIVSASSVTCARPSNVENGNLLLACVYGKDTLQYLTPPTGWKTLVHQRNSSVGTNPFIAIFYKLAYNEPETYTWTTVWNHQLRVVINRITNFSRIVIINKDFNSFNSVGDNSIVFPSIDLNGNDVLLFSCLSLLGNTASITSIDSTQKIYEDTSATYGGIITTSLALDKENSGEIIFTSNKTGGENNAGILLGIVGEDYLKPYNSSYFLYEYFRKTYKASTGSSISVSSPLVEKDDLIILNLHTYDGSANIISIPEGFQLLRHDKSINSGRVESLIYYKIATNTEIETYTITYDATMSHYASLFCYPISNVNIENPFSAHDGLYILPENIHTAVLPSLPLDKQNQLFIGQGLTYSGILLKPEVGDFDFISDGNDTSITRYQIIIFKNFTTELETGDIKLDTSVYDGSLHQGIIKQGFVINSLEEEETLLNVNDNCTISLMENTNSEIALNAEDIVGDSYLLNESIESEANLIVQDILTITLQTIIDLFQEVALEQDFSLEEILNINITDYQDINIEINNSEQNIINLEEEVNTEIQLINNDSLQSFWDENSNLNSILNNSDLILILTEDSNLNTIHTSEDNLILFLQTSTESGSIMVHLISLLGNSDLYTNLQGKVILTNSLEGQSIIQTLKGQSNLNIKLQGEFKKRIR